MAVVKKIQLVFNNGAVVDTPYSYKIYEELDQNLGKDHELKGKNFTANTKDVQAIFYQVYDVPEVEAAPEKVEESKKPAKK